MKAFALPVETVPGRMDPSREELIVLGIGDIQAEPALRGKPRAVDLDRLQETVQRGVDHGAYFVGMGDYVDMLSPSNRQQWRGTTLYDSPRDALDEAVYQTLDEVAEILEAAKGRWLGLLTGHHHYEFQTGAKTDSMLAERLETRWLGDGEAGLTLLLPAHGHHKRPYVKLMVTHGRNSGARSPGAVQNELYRLSSYHDGIDAVMVGHYHQRESKVFQKLRWEGGERGGTPTVRHRDVAVVCTGSFMKGYLQDQRDSSRSSYVELGLMSPAALGAGAVVARPVFDRGDWVRNEMSYYDY